MNLWQIWSKLDNPWWCKDLMVVIYNRWQDSFSHQNCPSMGKGKTVLPKAPGEMLKTTEGSAQVAIWLDFTFQSIYVVDMTLNPAFFAVWNFLMSFWAADSLKILKQVGAGLAPLRNFGSTTGHWHILQKLPKGASPAPGCFSFMTAYAIRNQRKTLDILTWKVTSAIFTEFF